MTVIQLKSELTRILSSDYSIDELVDYIRKTIQVIVPGFHIPYDNIKYCPHCNVRPSMFSYTDERGMPGSWYTYSYIQYPGCGFKTLEFSDYGQNAEKLCIESWNNDEIQKHNKIK